MDILAAIRREERKLEKQLGKLEHQLDKGFALDIPAGYGTQNDRESGVRIAA